MSGIASDDETRRATTNTSSEPAPARERRAPSWRNIGTEIYYALGLHQQEWFRNLGYREGDLPETEAAGRETLVLPVHPGLGDDQLDRVAEAGITFLRGLRGLRGEH